MTDTIKTIAQINPSANILTDLYTVPAVTSTAVSSVVICNQNSTDIAFRISIAIAGAGDAIKQYIYYDLPLMANDTFIATIGVTLATTDVVRVRSNTANVSFSLFGVEVT